MKAVVLTESRRLELQEVKVPEPGPGEVLLKPEYCGICGTDLHAAEIEMFNPPVVLGHEFSARVVQPGVGVQRWKAGDRVAINPNQNSCGTCQYCRAGRYNLCEVAIMQNSLGVRRNGGMAEFVAVNQVHLHRLPEGVGTLAGAWVEPLAVAVRAVRNSGLRLADRVAIIGGGPIGLLALQLAIRGGASHVTLVEPSSFRQGLATRLGADLVLSPEQLSAAPADVPPVALVIECSGHPSALETALRLVAPGGAIRLVGASPKPLFFTAMTALTKEVTITANFIYVDEFPQAISLLERGLVDVESLTSSVVPLDDFESAFAAVRRPDRTVKALIHIGAGSGKE
jgi:2-desacetyl-2-hydroxyethyl bacteriochlorophyllide A dehydrogenase